MPRALRGSPQECSCILECSHFSSNGREAVVLLLLENGADISARSTCGDGSGFIDMTPLMEATLKGLSEMVGILIEKGADVRATDGAGQTALYHVSQGDYTIDTGREELARMLLHAGADVSADDSTGMTPLHEAVDGRHEKVVRVLLDNGADVHAEEHDNYGTPLHLAAWSNAEAVAQLLLDHGADVSAHFRGSNYSGTPLHIAAWYGYTTMVQLLIDNGADVFAKDDDETPEDCAANDDITAMIKKYRTEKCEGFAMGHHERLGAGSRVRWLDAGVVRMVLEQM